MSAQCPMDEAREAARSAGIVVIGAGQAGGRAVEALRTHGFTGRITLIGDEEEHPYERPSLSKEMLHAAEQETVAWIQKPDFYAAQNILLRPGVRADVIDREQRIVRLNNGEQVNYGALILTTGARVRRLEVPGASNDTCHYLRTLADSRALRSRFIEGRRIVVIGAGFIGLEAAAAAIQRGCTVTVIEVGPLPLGRVVPAEIGAYYQRLHEKNGVTFLLDTKLVNLRKQSDVVIVETSAGAMIYADAVVVGIGVIPNDELAANAGLPVERGIIVDEFGMTEDKFIFAAGDVARHFNPLLGRHILLESWQNAQNQAIAIARNLASETPPTPYTEQPWFWSDQYDVNLQMFGLSVPSAQPVTRGDVSAKSWMMLQQQSGRIICAIGINAARELRSARDLIAMNAVIPPEDLADASIPLIEAVRREKRARSLVQ